jgi:tetratricopeptide (TPR) repeat protein
MWRVLGRLTSTVDSGHPQYAPEALINLGTLLLRKQGDVEGARAAYQQAIDSAHPDAAARGAFNLAIVLTEQGDVEGARAAYQQAIDSAHPDVAAKAAVNLGNLGRERGSPENAPEAYQVGIESGDTDVARGATAKHATALRCQRCYESLYSCPVCNGKGRVGVASMFGGCTECDGTGFLCPKDGTHWIVNTRLK